MGSIALWIDAVCINQADASERGQQVRLMGEIYQHATRTLIWLGDTEYSGTIMSEAVQMALQDMRKQTRTWRLWRQNSNPTRHHAKALHDLFARAWFQRLWVVQEAVLAPAATCFLGAYDFPWKDICDCAHWAENAPPEPSSCTRSKRPGAQTALLVREFSNEDKVPLAELLKISRKLEVSDPKDKVYAILGLAKLDSMKGIGRSELLVDYTKALSDIYAAATRAALLEAGNLGLLQEVEHISVDRMSMSEMHNYGDFPSWVPRYDRRPTPALNAAALHAFQLPELELQMDTELLTKHRYPFRTLPLRGCVVDRIVCVDPIIRYSNTVETRTGRGPGVLSRMLEVVAKHSTCSQEILRDLALSVTMLGSAIGLNGVPDATAQQDKDELLSRLDLLASCLGRKRSVLYALEQLRQYPHAERFIALLEQADPLFVNRRLFLTSAGIVGLGPQMMTGQRSESLVVLAGSDYPYILRTQEAIASSNDSGYAPLLSLRYELVGHCYVRSMVTGEMSWDADGRVFKLI